LAAKLKEIATAKGLELPSEPDEQTTQMLQRFEGLSGNQVSQFYLSESGVKGHEELERIMTEVQSKAQDNDLKQLAATALPLVRTHLQVARSMIPDSATGNKK
jgi:putative membrane protein